MQTTIPVPHPGAKITQSILNDLRTLGVFSGMQVFASLVEHGTTNGFPSYKRYPQGTSQKPKYFTSYSPLGVFIEGALPLAKAVPGYPPASLSDPSFNIYSMRVANFYHERCIAEDQEFLTLGIPRLVIRSYPDEGKMNFDMDEGKTVADLTPRTITDVEQAWPLGTIFPYQGGPITYQGWQFKATLPENLGLKFNLSTGLPEIFDYQKYDRAFPLETVVKVKGTGGGTSGGTPTIKAGQEEVFIQSLNAAWWAQNRVSAANDVVKKFVEVK